MNQFKEGLLKELQDVKFSQKRKQLIAEKARRKEKHQVGHQWTYRIVLATFTVLVIGFSYLLTEQKEQHSTGHQAATIQSDAWSWWSLFNSRLCARNVVVGLFYRCRFYCQACINKKRIRSS
ncbi:hypothetical protein Bsph_2381 [Lysinibacillus sphaericus C3-41]|uniref:Uncharacterized protein n=1 Tax=Lysinibacillus sphaericus (strain C3-41) TaxID=444177 RepID=B1HWU9_LYSSC|nr:hypothetical protein [Lysinibacillus sphaericus]ACA39934.1 hypothetical protein Bsph_2381 [Lysinibacillus sphaericus C3-41]